jgi:hypothetical protein
VVTFEEKAEVLSREIKLMLIGGCRKRDLGSGQADSSYGMTLTKE